MLCTSAESALPPMASQKQHKPWDSDEILICLLQCRRAATRNSTEYKSITKDVRKRVRELKRAHAAEQASKINSAAEARQVERAFFFAKSSRILNRRVDASIKCPGLREHFSDHFNHSLNRPAPAAITTEVPDFISALGQVPYDRKALHNNAASADELKSCIMKLRPNKATTDVPAEYLKVAIKDPEFCELLTDIFAEIWSTKAIPDDWRTNRLVTLFKPPGSW